MINFICDLFTKENITFVIAVAGFAISLFNLAHRRKSIIARILKLRCNDEILYSYIAFENHSELPIAITRIALEIDGNFYDATPIPKRIITRTRRIGKEIISRHEEYSTAIPMQLPSLGATTFLVVFEHLPTYPVADPTQVTLLTGTNRGKALKMSLELPPAWADPNTTP